MCLLLKRLRLNLRALRLALSGRWLRAGDVAESYDALAETYNANWLPHLCRTTDRLHERLPDADVSRVIDLGCGSGYSAAFLAKRFPATEIIAIDISGEMIAQARAFVGNKIIRNDCGGLGETALSVRFVQGDMLRFLESQPAQSCDLIFSAWAIGYSMPAKIIAESRRVLRPGGELAVIVNKLGTMPAVFAAFRKTMHAFPASLEKALWPRFPRTLGEIETYLQRHAFAVKWAEEGAVPITPPEPGRRLEWLLGTGVLAGFDSVLPLRAPGDPRRFFEHELDTAKTGWEHHYIMFVAEKKK